MHTRHINTLLIFFFAVLISVYWACSEDSTEPQSEEFVLPDSNLSYVDHIRPLFLAKCGSQAGCHSSVNPANGLDLGTSSTYTDLRFHQVNTDFGVVELITPGSGAGSFLYQILLTDIAGRQRMPRGGPYLNNNNIEGVRIWIDEGAPLAVE